MEEKKFVPYVPAETTMPESTVKALLLGVVMAIVLGAANAYLGMKVGMTVAATFPAAVVSMAVLRIFRGSILEENLARTTASVGEALVAGAVFTIPAFIISGAWSEFNLRDAMLIMGVGGVLGVLVVVLFVCLGQFFPVAQEHVPDFRNRYGDAGMSHPVLLVLILL